jgi:hypothetical protein
VAVTALLESRDAAFSNTYQQLDASSLAAFLAALSAGPGGIGPVNVDEEYVVSRLSDPTHVEFDLLYTGGLLFFGFADALRAHYGITGNQVPVLTKVGKVESFDRRGDSLGSVIRVRLAIGFLELAPPTS